MEQVGVSLLLSVAAALDAGIAKDIETVFQRPSRLVRLTIDVRRMCNDGMGCVSRCIVVRFRV